MANPVSAVVGILIGRIPAVRLSLCLKIRLDLHSLHSKQRPDYRDALRKPARRAHTVESVESAPPDQPKQHGLRIIIRMMRERDLHRSAVIVLCCLPEALIAELPRRLLNAEAVSLCIRRDIHRINPAANAPLFAKPFNKRGVSPAGISPDPVFHVHRLQEKIAVLPVLKQHKQQTYRVRSPGDARKHHIPGFNKPLQFHSFLLHRISSIVPHSILCLFPDARRKYRHIVLCAPAGKKHHSVHNLFCQNSRIVGFDTENHFPHRLLRLRNM